MSHDFNRNPPALAVGRFKGDIWDGETHYKYMDKYWNYGNAPFHYQLPIEYVKTPKL